MTVKYDAQKILLSTVVKTNDSLRGRKRGKFPYDRTQTAKNGSVFEAALTRGADLYQTFRKLVPLDAPLAADVVSVIARETGLGERRIRELARRYRSKPIAESLASRPRGPKPGSRQAPPEVLVAIDGLIEESF
ncbi:hypothetical protein [Novosphingobium sp. CECT 9465]|uniref:hypothetical protein n=1 Tax=Novosphingobium sp. CECT 9465 TaxID=2829794 RepID=UPI001E3965FF|nr:hypothetical protein [Novosphingobium sp. CECT 9465]CAH0499202.1 hypothetical protein NVSP9465_04301 [Novosphingobium sp. CECT 9465]